MSDSAKVATSIQLDAARRCVRNGLAVVPIPRGEKGPRISGWQNLRLVDSELPAYFSNGENLGVILGAASGGVVDADIDAAETLAIADSFLPQTGFIFGHGSKPRSHRFYLCDPLPAPQKFCAPDGSSLIELRSAGQQTVVPPSLHPSGELYEFSSHGEPARVDRNDLARCVRLLAAAALLARSWPKGQRNDAALALAGMLLHGGWGEEETTRFVEAVATAANDEETRQRISDVLSTTQRIATGRTTTGAPTLAAIMGDPVVARVRQWLALGPQVETVEGSAPTIEWPAPLDNRALYGLAGDVVAVIDPHTEADPAAILIQFLLLFGNAIERSAHFCVEGSRHFTNLFAVLVGTTSKGRKGSSFSQVERLFEKRGARLVQRTHPSRRALFRGRCDLGCPGSD